MEPYPSYPRSARLLLEAALSDYPVVVLTGARQSGKSTLLRSTLPGWRSVSLEDPDTREFAESDPRGFLRQHHPPLVIDEAQRVPSLFSYVQTTVDATGGTGRFVLSASQQFGLLAGVTQSLAGRAALVELHPLRLAELSQSNLVPATLDELLHCGGYPAVYSRGLATRPDAVARYYADYVQTYLERDVRSLSAVQDLGTFQRFLRLAAARTGQLLNLNGLAADCGVAHGTAAAWLNVLEASYVVRRIAPYHRNFGKRLVKAPKLYFLDTGLAAWLLGIVSPAAMATHYARGALFETWVVGEAIRWRAVRGDARPVYFWRDNIGNEVDVVLEQGEHLNLVEAKSGQTFQPEWLQPLLTVDRHTGGKTRRALLYGGDMSQERADTSVISWRDLAAAG